MTKTIVITLGSGNVSKGFPYITARLWSAAHPQAEQFVGSLDAAPHLADTFRMWQSTYRALANRAVLRQPTHGNDYESDEDELEIEPGGVTHVSQQSFEDYGRHLSKAMNVWLSSPGMLPIDRGLRSHLSPAETIRVIFETDDDLLRRLPWHCWDFFNDYPLAEMAISRPEYRRVNTAQRTREQVRVLAVIGDRSGIDITQEQQALSALPDADITFLTAPSRQLLDQHLWDSVGWDVLFFAGHSQTEGIGETQTGRLYINEQPAHNSLTVEQLRESLKGAIAHGLQLAIFNSCDGVGLARALGQLHIPQVIVMREPVPNRVAQQFLTHFLLAFAKEKLALYPAMRRARSQLQGLENLFPGASWLPVLCQNPAVQPITWAQMGGISRCPYKGLETFQEQDAAVFFGRENVVANLVAAIKQKPFVAITGASGSGKSSVVFAGIIPQLRRQPDTSWTICTFRPGAHPFEALAQAINPLAAESNRQSPADDVSTQLQTISHAIDFHHSPEQFLSTIRQIVSKQQNESSNGRLLLVVDQFEEIYTLCDEGDRQAFIALLLDTVDSLPAFTLLITLRADFYGLALSDRRLSDALQVGSYNLGPMNQEELQQAIEQPAQLGQVTFEPGLTDVLLAATQDQTGRLPLLEFTLMQLWSQQQDGQLTHQSYQTIGGIEAALSNYADTAYAQLSAADQQRVAHVFMQLIAPGEGTGATRRVARREEIGEDNWDLVTRLASARLVVTNRNSVTGEDTVEIIHEALITGWGQLNYWIQTNADFRRWQESVRSAIARWSESGQDTEALLRGKHLSIAEDWYHQRSDELAEKEQAFIQQSIAAQDRQQQQVRRRRRTTITGLLTGLLITSALSIVTWWALQRVSLQQVNAQATASEALFTAGQPLDSLMAALRAYKTMDSVVRVPSSVREDAERTLRQALASNHEVNRLIGHTAGTTKVFYSPDGQILAVASKDRTITLWNPNGQQIATLEGHDGEIWGLAISPDGQTVLSASSDQTVRRWRTDGTPIDTLSGHTAEVNTVAFHPDGDRFVSADESGVVKIWNSSGEVIRTFQAHEKKIDAIAFSPNGQLLSTGSGDGTIKLWSGDGELQQTLTGHSGSIRGIAFSPDGQTIASASADQKIKLWTTQGNLIRTLSDHNNIVFDVAFSRDGQSLFSASDDKTVRHWNVSTGRPRATFFGHQNGATSIALSPDGQQIASTSYDRTVRLWQPSSPIRTTVGRHSAVVRDVAFSPIDSLIASSSIDDTIQIHSLQSTQTVTLQDSSDVYALAYSPNGKTLVSGNGDGRLLRWDVASSQTNTLSKTDFQAQHSDWVTDVDFSPDGQWLASSSADGTVKRWQSDGTLINSFSAGSDEINSLAVSPDQDLIVTAGSDGSVKFWGIDGTPVSVSEQGHLAAVTSVAFSPDGQRVVSASDDGTIHIYRPDGTLTAQLEGHQQPVIEVVFSPAGDFIASSSVDKTVRLWSADGQLLETFSGYTEGLNGIAFNSSGDKLAVGSVDGTITLWDLRSALELSSLIELSCQTIDNYLKNSANLSMEEQQVCR